MRRIAVVESMSVADLGPVAVALTPLALLLLLLLS